MLNTVKIGKRGTIVIPSGMRKRLGFEEGKLAIIEDFAGGITIRPATAIPIEIYSLERRAALILENAIDDEDYARVVAEVRNMGLDPDKIPHERP